MTRNPVRFGAAALGLATLFATSTAGAATAVPGVGTSQTTTNVVSVQVGKDGSLVGLRLLSDDGRSTIDKSINAQPQAYSRLTPLDVSSSAVPALTAVGQTVASTATLERRRKRPRRHSSVMRTAMRTAAAQSLCAEAERGRQWLATAWTAANSRVAR